PLTPQVVVLRGGKPRMFSRWHVAVVRSLAPLLTALCAVVLIHDIGDAGTLELSWTAPTTTVTGMPLTNLAGYRVYYGTASAGCPGSTYVTVPSSTPTPAANQALAWTLSVLTSGTAYNVTVTAVDTHGEPDGAGEWRGGVGRGGEPHGDGDRRRRRARCAVQGEREQPRQRDHDAAIPDLLVHALDAGRQAHADRGRARRRR